MASTKETLNEYVKGFYTFGTHPDFHSLQSLGSNWQERCLLFSKLPSTTAHCKLKQWKKRTAYLYAVGNSTYAVLRSYSMWQFKLLRKSFHLNLWPKGHSAQLFIKKLVLFRRSIVYGVQTCRVSGSSECNSIQDLRYVASTVQGCGSLKTWERVMGQQCKRMEEHFSSTNCFDCLWK